MADNFTTDSGSGGETFASDDVSSVQYPISKLAYGALNTIVLVSTANGFPVQMDVTTPGTTNSVAIITGQDGIAGDAGAVGATVPRVTLASDDPAVVDLAAIEVLITAGNVDLAAMEVLLGTIDADTGAMATDLAAIETLITAGNVDLAAMEVLITAGNVDLAAMEVLLGTIDADTGAMVTDLAAMEALLITIDSDTNDIKTAVELIDTVGGGTEAAAMRVTLANDSTGLLSVDDNGGSLTADIPAVTSGGCDFFKSIDLDESEEEVKGAAGQLYGGIVMNMKATPLYLKIYNATAANVTVGTTAPDLTIPIPSSGDTNGAGFNLQIPAQGIAFGTAITVACTTGVADADDGAPGANECVVALWYK